MKFSLKKPKAFLWSTDHSLDAIREKLARGNITGEWLVCPLGEAKRAAPVSEFLASPAIFDPVPTAATPPPLPATDSADQAAEIVPFDRRHDLDALRATAMLLGIGLHGGLAYITAGVWPIDDGRDHVFFDHFFSAVHGFRMPLFFMISGFFTAMLWRKRGLPYLTRHRMKRILLPMVLFMATILPLMWGIFIGIGIRESARNSGPQASTTVWMAAKNNDVEALETHLEGVEDINAPDPQHQLPALNWAALSGSTEAAALLIEAGADINVRIDDQSTPMTHAAFTGHTGIVELLIEDGADLNAVNIYRSTPLDSTYADWGTVEWVAGALGLEIDRETMEEGHEAVRELLRENGGKHHSELEQEARDQAAATGEGRSFTAAYLAFAKAPAFTAVQPFAHLWFLWFLCILFVPFAVYALVARVANWSGPPQWLVLSPVVLLWLVPLTMIPQWFHGLIDPSTVIGPDTSASVFPPPHIIILYAVYFFFGVIYFDCDDKEGRLGRFWWLTLPVALFTVYPVAMAATFNPESTWIQRFVPGEGVRLLAVAAQALFAWLMIFGMMGLFRKVCSNESKVLRYVSDSSYWLYVAHLPLIFLAQYLVKPLELPAFVKFGIVCTAVTGVLLVSYGLIIRYTWIGTLLNGKRRRSLKKNAASDPLEATKPVSI